MMDAMTRATAPGAVGATITGGRAALGVVAVLHVVAFALLAHGVGAGGTGLAASAVIAYTLGLRHALDADHLCMIDNSTRKFVADGRPSAAVGLAFSAGHSTVVFAASVLVLAGVGWVSGALDEGSSLRGTLGVVGATVAATYLLAMAMTNTPVLVRAWRSLRAGGSEPEGHHLRGGISRLLATPLAGVRRPWQIYLFGLLFGLGFDTASSVALLILATGASAGAPLAGLLALPLLFAAAMTLGDSLNAFLMVSMYTSAHRRRRARYDVVITSVSIAAAVAIALITYAQLGVDLGIDLDPLRWVAGIDTEWAGAGLLVFFAVVGAVAALLAAAGARTGRSLTES